MPLISPVNIVLNHSLRLGRYAAELNIDKPKLQPGGTAPKTTEEILPWLTRNGYPPPPLLLEIWWRLQDRLANLPACYKHRSGTDLVPHKFSLERLDGLTSESWLEKQGEDVVLMECVEDEKPFIDHSVFFRTACGEKTPLELTDCLLPAILRWHVQENAKWPSILLPLRASLEGRRLTFARGDPFSFEFGTPGMELRLEKRSNNILALWEAETVSDAGENGEILENLGAFVGLDDTVREVATEFSNGYAPFPVESTLEFLQGQARRPVPWTIGPDHSWSAEAKRRLKRLKEETRSQLDGAMASFRRQQMQLEI